MPKGQKSIIQGDICTMSICDICGYSFKCRDINNTLISKIMVLHYKKHNINVEGKLNTQRSDVLLNMNDSRVNFISKNLIEK